MVDLATWAEPMVVDHMALAFGVSDKELARLLPPMAALPKAFQRGRDPWCAVTHRWFFRGLPKDALRAKPGIDEVKALEHCAAVLQSFAPKHEHKVAGVAWLLSQWFESPPTDAVRR